MCKIFVLRIVAWDFNCFWSYGKCVVTNVLALLPNPTWSRVEVFAGVLMMDQRDRAWKG